MKLEFKKRTLEIDVYGEAVCLNFPTVGQYRKYQARMAEGKETESELMIELVTELGMSENLLNELEPSHLKDVIDLLVGAEKK